MFCSECGSRAAGKYCSNCGSPLRKVAESAASAGPLSETISSSEVLGGDEALVPAQWNWEEEVSYEHLVQLPAVRAALAQHAAQARTGLTCEKFLEICDQVIPGQVSYAGVAAVAQPLWASLGVRTGKESRRQIAAPIGRAIARAICSLARHGQKMQNVEQFADGCSITAELPSSLFAMKGELQISLRRVGNATEANAATHIPGQAFDWGKSRRCLQDLWGDMESEMGLPLSGPRRQAA